MVDLQLGTKKNRSTLMGGISVVMEFSVICPTGMRRSVPNIARVCSRETWSRHNRFLSPSIRVRRHTMGGMRTYPGPIVF